MLLQTVRKEGPLALYKGARRLRARARGLTAQRRHALAAAGNRGRELAPVCGVRVLEARRVAVPAALARRDRARGRHGRRDQRRARQPRCVASAAPASSGAEAAPVEMFKVRMQAQYGQPGDKRLSVVARDMWTEWGFRKGVMRGFWVRTCGCSVLRSI